MTALLNYSIVLLVGMLVGIVLLLAVEHIRERRAERRDEQAATYTPIAGEPAAHAS
jgi:hypothetical protein